MDPDHIEIKSDITSLGEKLEDIRVILVGNGKIGVAEQARRAFEMCQSFKKSKNGLLDWTFRIAIGFIMGFIAVKVGLK